MKHGEDLYRPELVRPWEHEASFNEVLAAQLKRTPYLLASLMVHGLLGLALAGFLFLARGEESEPPTIAMAMAPPPPEVEKEDPPPDPDVKPIVEEPQLHELELEQVPEQESLEKIGDVDFEAESPFERTAFNKDIGVGGNVGGLYGGRGGRGSGGRGKGDPTEIAVRDALQWLADHQSPEGFWDADEFMFYDKHVDQPPSTGPGDPVNDVGLTGLALLAFLGKNNTTQFGSYRDQVLLGIQWLREVQRDDGLFGEEVGNPTLYNHSIATLAFAENYNMTRRSPTLRKNLKNAVNLIVEAREDYGAWRYRLQPSGAGSDTSVTGWMVFALKAAREGGIPVSNDNFEGAEAWFDQMTNEQGRTGYAMGEGGGPGSFSSRRRDAIERFPAERSEALTAVALLCRMFMTDTEQVRRWNQHDNFDELKRQAALVEQLPPVWDREGGGCDMYYWYYGTYAMNQWGGQAWKTWKKAIEKTLIPHQRRDGNFRGSWDPIGPWGQDGGRVYSTAICTLVLQVYYRYPFLLGAR